MALVNLKNISVFFGDLSIVERVNLLIQPRERICLLGRNGEGKSTLMKVIHGDLLVQKGDVFWKKNLRTSMLDQELKDGIFGNIRSVVSGLVHNNSSISPLGDVILTRMKLNPNSNYETLSIGLKRRVLLARTLVSNPDLLLLDEPTNHLDIETITWLETFLKGYSGALVFITHDRVFMQKLATRIVEIDRGKILNWECTYPTYLRRKKIQLKSEEAQNAKFDKKLSKEEEWIRQGIRARQTRNEGRVRALKRAREAQRNRRAELGKVRLVSQNFSKPSKQLINAKAITYGYDRTLILEGFSTTILRGDKVGIIGPNGAGKTTLLRLLLGELKPIQGTVKHNEHLQIGYFDQRREQLEGEKTVFDSVANGSDRVSVNGKNLHVFSYLKNFLFSPERSQSLVKTLSGGEQNRLLLAKLFTYPASLLALDEPTNDLDSETLEVLESMLVDYTGTLLIVTHDRAFLNNVVTSIIAFEEQKGVIEYIGGYDDYLKFQSDVLAPNSSLKNKKQRHPHRPRRLSYMETQELDRLPEQIEILELERQNLFQTLSDSDVYKRGKVISELRICLKSLEEEIETAYKRWEILENLR